MVNRTLIGNKARFITERRAWIEIARMESEAKMSPADLINASLGALYQAPHDGPIDFPFDWEAPDGWSPFSESSPETTKFPFRHLHVVKDDV